MIDLDGKYRAALKASVEIPYETIFSKLTTDYLRDLEKGEKSVRDDLEAVMAWRNERRRVSGEPPQEGTETTPDSLLRLRTGYEERKDRLGAEQAAKATALTAKYVAALEVHERSLTRDRRIEEALAVKKWRESLGTPKSPDGSTRSRDVRFEGTFAAGANLYVQGGQLWVADRSVAQIPENLKVNGKQWKPSFDVGKVSEKLTLEPAIASFSGSSVKLEVRKRGDGSGIIEIAGQPSEENGQLLSIFLNDVGADWGLYEITLSW